MFKKSLAVSCAVAAVLGGLAAKTALAASLPAPTVDGKIFADLTNLDQTNNGTKTANSGTGVDVKRFYLVFGETFNDVWSAKIVTDATFNSIKASTCSGTGATTTCSTATNNLQANLYIKNAFIQATLSKAFWARLGDANMPWIPFDEGLYGYRYVENTLIDRLHFGNSADWGLHVGGRLDDGMVSYRVSAVNGNGYKNYNRSKDMDVEGRLTYRPIDGLTLALGGYSGKLGHDTYGATTYHTANRVDAIAAYVNHGVRVGVEYFSANDWNNVTSVTSDKADGTSAWASYNFTPVWAVFGRWDQAKLSKDLSPGLKDNYFNLGVQMQPTTNVDVALVYKHEKMDGGLSTGSFATTNGSAFNEFDGKYDEVGIWGQVAF